MFNDGVTPGQYDVANEVAQNTTSTELVHEYYNKNQTFGVGMDDDQLRHLSQFECNAHEYGSSPTERMA